jgi:hypothetical protein
VGSIYRRHPVGIAKELGGIFQDRYERVLRGEILWDSFDWTMIGVLAVFVLLVVWTTYRWVRLRRLVRQVHALKARVVELEQVQPAVLASGQELEAPSRSSARPDFGSTRARRSPSMRRSGFTAVISSKDYLSQTESGPSTQAEVEVAEAPAPLPAAAVAAETAPDLGAADDDDVRRMLDDELGEPETVGVASGRPAAEAGTRGAEPRRVIGARVWEEKGRDADDPARTQLIVRVPDSSGPAVSLPEVEPRVAREIATPSLADDSAETDGKETSDNGDLIDELKAVIHRKFDELMK